MRWAPLGALVGVLACAAACPMRVSSRYDENPPWPFVVRAIAVFPVEGPETLDADGFGREFANQLVSFPGVERVVYPDDVRRAMRRSAVDELEGALEAAAQLGADALIAIRVHDHTPYRPKRMVLSVQLLSTRQQAAGAPDLDALVRQGRWAPDPLLPLGDAHARHVVDMIQRRYDARHEMTKWRMDAYDRAKTRGGFEPGVMTESVEEVFWGFVAQEVIRELIDREVVRQSHVASS